MKLIKQLVQENICVIAEGKFIHLNKQDKLKAGCCGIVVGGAITRPQEITKRFVDALNKEEKDV